jgi:hypothetical protein
MKIEVTASLIADNDMLRANWISAADICQNLNLTFSQRWAIEKVFTSTHHY